MITVGEMIGYLNQMPKDMPMKFNVHNPQSEYFIFSDIVCIDMVQTEADGKIILIHDGSMDYEDDEEDFIFLN